MYFSYSNINDDIDVNFAPLEMTPEDEFELNIRQIFDELEEYNIFYSDENLPSDIEKLKDLYRNLNDYIDDIKSNKKSITVKSDEDLWSVTISLDENNKFKFETHSKLLEDYEWFSKYEWLDLKDDEDFISVEFKKNDLTINKETNDLKSIIKNSIKELLLQFNINPDYLSDIPDEQLIHPILSLKKAYFNLDKHVVNNQLVKNIHSIDPYVDFSYEASKNIYDKPLIILKANDFNKIITQITKH